MRLAAKAANLAVVLADLSVSFPLIRQPSKMELQPALAAAVVRHSLSVVG
jgi:hypothetical protein